MAKLKCMLPVQNTSLSQTFLKHKHSTQFKAYWNFITKPCDRKLCNQFRVGLLAIKPFTTKWQNTTDIICPSCQMTVESIPHILFTCPAYKCPRDKWLKPICQNLGSRSSIHAFRILKTNTHEHIVIATGKFLSWSWGTQSNNLKKQGATSGNHT